MFDFSTIENNKLNEFRDEYEKELRSESPDEKKLRKLGEKIMFFHPFNKVQEYNKNFLF